MYTLNMMPHRSGAKKMLATITHECLMIGGESYFHCHLFHKDRNKTSLAENLVEMRRWEVQEISFLFLF